MKTITIGLIALLLFGVFATTFALAQEISDVSEISDSASEQQEAQELITESNGKVDDVQLVGNRAVTLAEGWMTSNGKGLLVRAMWVSGKSLKVDKEQVKQIRDQYAGDKAKIQEELAKITTEVSSFSHGMLDVGQGKDMEKYKLVQKEMTNKTASFYVLPVNSKAKDENASLEAVGTLALTRSEYSGFSLWSGKLNLKSGTNAGDWSVEVASKHFAMKKFSQAQGQEKKSFWDKIFGWMKPKKNADKNQNPGQGNPQGQDQNQNKAKECDGTGKGNGNCKNK